MKLRLILILSVAVVFLLALSATPLAQVPDTIGFGINAFNNSLGGRINGTHTTEINIYSLVDGAQTGEPLANGSELINYFQGVGFMNLFGVGTDWTSSYCFTTRIGVGTESGCGNITPHLQSLYAFNSSTSNHSLFADNSTFTAGVNWDDVTNQPTINGTSTTDEIQDLWATVAGDTGSTTASSSTDTLTIAGGNDIDTSVSGDTLTCALQPILNTVTDLTNTNLRISGQNITITNTVGGYSIFINQDADAGSSQSVGGAMRIDGTGNIGTNLNVYTNQDGTVSGHSVSIMVDNEAFDQVGLRVRYDGSANAVVFDCRAPGGDESSQCLNVASNNTRDTTVGINSFTSAHSAVKVDLTGDMSTGSRGAAALGLFSSTNSSDPFGGHLLFFETEDSAPSSHIIHMQNGSGNLNLFGLKDGSLNSTGAFNSTEVNAGTARFGDSVTVGNQIIHGGDTNTNIAFTSDQLVINTGGSSRFVANSAGTQTVNGNHDMNENDIIDVRSLRLLNGTGVGDITANASDCVLIQGGTSQLSIC